MDTSKIGRYGQIVAMLAKYGRADFIDAVSAEYGDQIDSLKSAVEHGRGPEDLVADITELGPTFVKLAQMLSTRADLLSEPFVEALSELQDDVAGLDLNTVERILAEEFPARVNSLFENFESKPLAAASLSQVHRATLRGGRQVVVKIQRPEIREQIEQDLEILSEVAGAIDRHTDLGRRFEFSRLHDQFKIALLAELDFRKEANNLSVLADELDEFDRLIVPRPVPDLVTAKVLVMDYIEGTSVSSIGPLAKMELDIAPLAASLCEAYLHQVLVTGFFQSDPHPGNILLTPDCRLAVIDLGMVAHVEASLRERLLRLLLALSEAKGRETAELCLDLGELREGADPDRFVTEVGDLVTRRQHEKSTERKLGRTLLQIVGIYTANGIRPPVEVGLMGKTMLLLDEVARELDPDFDPDSVMANYAQTLLRRFVSKRLNPHEAAGKLLETSTALERLPRQVNAILEMLSRGEMRFRVDAMYEANLLRSLERVGNRIALGLVLSALIVGAALLMRVETAATIFGYPALAIVLFLAAAVLGFVLAIQLIAAERRDKDDTASKSGN